MADQFAQRAVILVTPVDLVAVPEWEPGPLPFAEGDWVATADVRRTYFNERSGQALYGADRAHRWAAPGEGLELLGAAFELVGVEILRAPGDRLDRNGLAVIHGRFAADGLALVETLQALSDIGGASSPLRRWCDEALDGCGVVGPSIKRAMTMTLVTPAGRSPPAPADGYEAWPAELQWLWLLASATPAEAYLPPPEAREALAGSLVGCRRAGRRSCCATARRCSDPGRT